MVSLSLLASYHNISFDVLGGPPGPPRECRLPGCNKPCFKEGYKTHDYCGRSHAQEHQAMMKARSGGFGRQNSGGHRGHDSSTSSGTYLLKTLIESNVISNLCIYIGASVKPHPLAIHSKQLALYRDPMLLPCRQRLLKYVLRVFLCLHPICTCVYIEYIHVHVYSYIM